MADQILSNILFFGAGFSLLLAITILFVQKINQRSLAQAILFLLLGSIVIPPALHSGGHVIQNTGYRLFARIPPFIIGPLILVYIRQQIDTAYKIDWRDLRLTLPPVIFVSLAISVVVFAFPASDFFYNYLIIGGSNVYVASYLFYAWLLLRRQKTKWPPDQQGFARMAEVILALYLAAGILGIVGMLTIHDVNHWSSVLVIGVLITQFILSQKYPQMILLRMEEERVKYRRSLLKDIDLAKTEAKVRAVLEQQKLFLNEEISLAMLSEEVGLTTYQLSEFLNAFLKTSFHTLINDYRIKEACAMLVAEPERTVLSIGYAVGFNSKSSFNEAFQRRVGSTPVKYRKSKL